MLPSRGNNTLPDSRSLKTKSAQSLSDDVKSTSVETRPCCIVLPFSIIYFITQPLIGERSIAITVSVCLSVCVCLSAIIFSELHVQSSTIFLCMLPMAVARSSSGGVVIRYVLPVYGLRYKPRLLDVAAQLKCGAHAALGLAINCAQ